MSAASFVPLDRFDGASSESVTQVTDSGRWGSNSVHVDSELVRACQRGDPGALDALIRATYADVYRLARRLVGDTDDAADATQEVFVKVMRAMVAFRGDAAFSTWLHRVTVNTCLDLLERRGRGRERGGTAGVDAFAVPGDERAEALADTRDGPVEQAESAHDRAELSAALNRLSPTLRSVVVLRDVEGLSTKDVATFLGISESAVKVRLFRAHEQLRQELEEQA